MPLELFIKLTCYLPWPGFVWHSQYAPSCSPLHPLSHLHLFPTPSSLNSVFLSKYELNIARFKQFLLTHPPPPSAPHFGPYLATFEEESERRRGEREREHGRHLTACALTSTRLAGVINRWLASGGGQGVVKKGEIKMWDGRQGYVGLLLINTRTWHTPPRCQVMCLILAQPSCHPSAQMWYHLSGGGANTGINFRYEGKMLIVHSSEILTHSFVSILSLQGGWKYGKYTCYFSEFLSHICHVCFHFLKPLNFLT